MFYVASFVAAILACCVCKYLESSGAKGVAKNGGGTEPVTHAQKQFQQTYLVVYVCAFFSDWLQGPYVYALYESYGYSEMQIAYLFLAGFGMSGVSGPFVGAAADNFGRRRLCVAYFVCYILSCLTKPINSMGVLMVGRILGGLATSLLYTVFESWMVAEHHRRKYPQALLDDTFAKSTLFNGLSAVAAGLIAQAGAASFGFVGPFMVSLLPLTLGCGLCLRWWRDDAEDMSERNTPPPLDMAAAAESGELDHNPASPLAGAVNSNKQAAALSGVGSNNILTTLFEGVQAMNADPRIWCLGLAQALFEGGMYTFVFLWTPALCEGLSKEEAKAVPYGLIFATFMVMIMVGSSLFSILLTKMRMEALPFVIHAGAAFCCVLTMTFLGQSHFVFATFVLFELCCGIFFPTYGSLRSIVIPEKQRSTIMNIFRVPLNLFVVVVLVQKKGMTNFSTFLICMCSHLLSAALWAAFTMYDARHKNVQRAQEDF